MAQAVFVQVIQQRRAEWPAVSPADSCALGRQLPTVQAQETLEEISSRAPDWNSRSTAQLSLGIMARSLASVAPKRASRIVQSLMDQLKSAATDEMRKQLLLSLGNAGAVES